MSWVLPFLFIQLAVHPYGATASFSLLLGSGLVLALVGTSLLVVRSTTGRRALLFLSTRTRAGAHL
jgi:hypothetical protein